MGLWRTLRSPYVTNCLTYGSLFCGAEMAQQIMIRKYGPWSQSQPTEEFDLTKVKHLSGWGFVAAPSYMALWYGWLDTKYPVANTVRVIAWKTVLDQTLLTIPLLLVFFPYMSWCQGQSDITKELREKFWVTYAASCCWFLPAQAINFKFVPARLRIVYNGVCGFVWANVLCYIKRSGEKKED